MEYLEKRRHNRLFSPPNTSLGKFWATAYHERRQPTPAATFMTKNRTPDPAAEASLPALALEKAEKGSHRSMWELLFQLRVLLPYLARLAPLLDRGLIKAAPDFSEVHKGIAALETGSRDLEVQARNQALQLERIEQQMARLRVVHENSIEESRILASEIRSFRHWMVSMAVVVVLLLLASVGMVAFLVMRP
jgi:hypothetical protein